MESLNERQLRVLVADDERDAVMTLGILLRSEGFNVRLAQCGADVPAIVEDFRPHAVLLDLVMRDRGGLELARELRRKYSEHCPILIALTGQRLPEAQAAAAHSGFQYFLRKPYDPDALISLVASLQRPDSTRRRSTLS